MKGFQSFGCLCASVLILIFFAIGRSDAHAGDSPATHNDKNGKLVVLVITDDVYRTPARDAYIEVHSFNVNWVAEKSFVLTKVKAGQYEATLPPGVYDVFVSEPTSTPRCRRLLVTANRTGYWSLMLEHDDVYLER